MSFKLVNKSIITPCYNTSRYIRELYESILAQKRDDLEWIVVDDGSTDESPALIDGFKAEGKLRIAVLHTKNLGACHARNEGFKISSGERVMFIDADDYIEKGYFENDSEAAISPDTVIVHETKVVVEKKGKKSRLYVHPLPDNAFKDVLDRHIRQPVIYHGACEIPRQYVEKIGGYDETLKADQDGDFMCRIILEGAQFHPIKSSLFVIRDHDGERISNNNSASKWESRLESCMKLITELEKRGLSDHYKNALCLKMERLADVAYGQGWNGFGERFLREVATVDPHYKSQERLTIKLLRFVMGRSLFGRFRLYVQKLKLGTFFKNWRMTICL